MTNSRRMGRALPAQMRHMHSTCSFAFKTRKPGPFRQTRHTGLFWLTVANSEASPIRLAILKKCFPTILSQPQSRFRTMTTAILTPQTNQTPAVANVTPELSGSIWVGRFLAQTSTASLAAEFRVSVELFIAALKDAGATVHISNTLRPRERAYLMHWAHKIYRNNFDPAAVPGMAGVNIEWVHPTMEQSIRAARNMVQSFGIHGLAANTPPALNTLHTAGKAIDMSISWTGNLSVKKEDGTSVLINTLPRTGMNLQLKQVGQTYGVIKFVGGNADRPHWSTNGH